MGYLTTHVLDTAQGVPAANLKLRLYRYNDNGRDLLCEVSTNKDGRCNQALLEAAQFTPGNYELEFDVGEYFSSSINASASIAFLDTIPIRFGVNDVDAHYHVPLLVSPYGYSTYRGS